MKVAILRDDHPESSRKWEIACEKKGVKYRTVNMLRDDWFQRISSFSPDFCVSRPPGSIQADKKLFDEKIYFLERFTGYPVFPGFLATYIYENKAALAWFLRTNNIRHPDTFCSSSLDESMEFIRSTTFPIVAKTLIGASGSGVEIMDSLASAEAYVYRAFKEGIRRSYGPNRRIGNPLRWLAKAIRSPSHLYKRVKQYNEHFRDIQKGVVLFQKYIPHEYEWRCAKIGDSYFAYKKLNARGKSSGSQQFDYGAPPIEILDMTRDICVRHDFVFMTIDYFEHERNLYINEMQTIFGHSRPHICIVEGDPGRFRYLTGRWTFQSGCYNSNESYDLRLNTILERYGG